MRRIAAILLALCLPVAAVDVDSGRISDITWNLVGGEYVAVFGSPTPTPGPYDWDTAYTNSVLLWEFYNVAEDTSYIGTNAGTLGAGGAAPTKVAATGGVSACYSDDGGDRITRPLSGEIKTAAGTVMGWSKYSGTAGGANFCGVGNSVAGPDSYWYFGPLNNFARGRAALANNGVARWQVDTTVDATKWGANVWFHWAVVHNGTLPQVYINGRSNAVTRNITTDQTQWLTRLTNADQVVYFKTVIDGTYYGTQASLGDQHKIYSRALTAAEVLTNFWYTASPQTTNGGHGWTDWDFDNRGAGGLYEKQALACSFNPGPADQSTNGNHGTLGASTAAPTWSAPDNNGAYVFDGVNDIITYTVAQTKNAYTLWAITNVTWRHYAELGGTQYVDAVAASFTNKFWFTSGTTVTLGKNASVFGAFTADNFRIFTALTPAQLTALKNVGRQ